jgi:hypothetical protein
MNILNALKVSGGDFEINRVVGAIGGLSYIFGANAFEAYEVFWAGKAFDLTAYCLSFPAGLGVAVGAIAGAISLKDRNVAVAKSVAPAAVPAPEPESQQ